MADANVNTVSMTEKQKVKESTDKLEEGLRELFESEKHKSYLSTMSVHRGAVIKGVWAIHKKRK